jgi:L-asparaginase
MAGLLPRVGLMLTGGTIDSVGTDRLDLAWYIEANKRLGDGELLAQLPELKSIARVQEIRSVVFRAKHWLIPTGSI